MEKLSNRVDAGLTEWTWQPEAEEPGSGSLPAPTRFPIGRVTSCRFLMDLQVERQREL